MEEFGGSQFFLNIPVIVADDERLTDKDALIFGEINSMLNVTGKFWMSNKKIAKKRKCSESTVKASLNRLESCGYIKREKIIKDKQIVGRYITLGSAMSYPTLGQNLDLPQGEILTDPRSTDWLQREYINKTTNITSTTTADAEIEQLADVQAHYQTNLRPRGGIPSAVNQWLADYTKELGSELVKFAITKGVNQTSNPGPNYIKSILDSWKKKGIATVEQAENEKKARTTSKRVNRKKEVTDDGFGGFEEFL